MNSSAKRILIYLFSFGLLFALGTLLSNSVSAACDSLNAPACQSVDVGEFGFKIPSLGDILTFAIRGFFVIAGLAALFYMLLGAFAWVTSGGDADAVGAAQQKIQAAVLGLIIIVAVLAIVWTLEQVIFARRICLGLSCPVTLPGIIESTDTDRSCCACVNETTGQLGDVIDAFVSSCDADGTKKGTVTD